MGILGTTSNILTKLKMDITDHKAKLKTVKGLEKERFQAQHAQMEQTNAGIDKGIGRLTTMAVAVGAVTGAVILLKRSFEQYSERQRVLSAGAGKNLGMLRKASLGLVTDTKLLRLEASLLNSKFKLTGAQMADVVGGIMSLRKQFGDLDLTIEEVTKAFVEVDAGGLKRFSIGLEGAAGSQEIFLNMLKEMREQSQKFGGDLHVAGDSAQKTMVDLTNKTETLTVKMGSLADKVLPGLAKAFGGILGLFDDILKDIENIAAAAGKFYFDRAHDPIATGLKGIGKAAMYPGYKLRQVGDYVFGKMDKLFGIDQPRFDYDEAVAKAAAETKRINKEVRRRELFRDNQEAGQWNLLQKELANLRAYVTPDFVTAPIAPIKRKKRRGRPKAMKRPLPPAHWDLIKMGTSDPGMQFDESGMPIDEMHLQRTIGGIPMPAGMQMPAGWEPPWDTAEAAAKMARDANDNLKLIAEGVGIKTLKAAFESLTDSILASFDAWMDGSLNAAEAFADMWRQMLKTIATMALTESLMNTAKGFSQMAMPDPLSKYSASQYFKSAGLWAGVAAIAGGSAYLTRDTSSAPATSASIQRGSGGQGRTQTIIIGSDFEGDTPRNRAHRLRDILSHADKSGSSSVVEFG